LVAGKTSNPRRSSRNVLRSGFSVRKLDKPITYRKLVFDRDELDFGAKWSEAPDDEGQNKIIATI
jgi:hypothetical protein